jgi:predicted RNA-binding protein YlqC (UPF0109 family)
VSATHELSPEAFLKDVLVPMLDHPDEFRVEVKGEGRKRDILIHAEQKDRGRIIGKNGRMISSLRTLLKAAGEKSGLILNLELYEEEGSKPDRRPEREEAH